MTDLPPASPDISPTDSADCGVSPAKACAGRSHSVGAPDSQMEADHARDMADARRMEDLRIAIVAFLSDPPSRLWPQTRDAVDKADFELKRQSDHIVAVWD